MPRNLHLSLFRVAAGFIDAAASCPLVPPADCHNASCCTAAASCPINNPPPLVCKRLPSRWPLVCQLVVVSPLLSRRRRLSSSQHATSASCPLDMPPPPRDEPPTLVCWRLSSRLPLFCQLVLTYHLVPPPPQVYILNPCLHSHWLVVASHLVVLLLPTILSSTPPPLDALATQRHTSRLPLVCPNWLPVYLIWYTQ